MPSISPSNIPSIDPTISPTFKPTMDPTSMNDMTLNPTGNTDSPSISPTQIPSLMPTILPSITPSNTPSSTPTVFPSISPSMTPTISPAPTPAVSLVCKLEGLYETLIDNNRVEVSVCESDMVNGTYFVGLSWRHSISNEIYTYAVSRIVGDDESASGTVYILSSEEIEVRGLIIRCSREQGGTGPPIYELQIQNRQPPFDSVEFRIQDISNQGSPQPWCFEPNGVINNGQYPQLYEGNLNRDPRWLMDSDVTGCYRNPIRSSGGTISGVIYPNDWNNMLRLGRYSVDGSVMGSFMMVLNGNNNALISYSDGMDMNNDGNRYISNVTFSTALTCPLNP
eukprot:CAMPEP_0114657028 /NCGR_PEP_ID=MMETSP0191-20121206/13249_1 /TAXON_ID=126664 /ORGANISM="Sorites sp." /LENGTH=337 /DNA_ID=CAMNT_0001875463 /DNA_START=326 /DNA_END=1339 /DNA_ORIENTATION=-